MPSLNDLPNELQQVVVGELNTRDLYSLNRTCQVYRKAVMPLLWEFASFQLDNLTRESWPTCMYVDDDLRRGLPLLSEDPAVRRVFTVNVGQFPGFCRMASQFEPQMRHVKRLLISLPFYTKHAEGDKQDLSCASDYDDYLAWFANHLAEFFPNVQTIEVESDTLYTEEVAVDHPFLPRVFAKFPSATKHLKLSLSREMDLLAGMPFNFRIIKLRYGYTQIINDQICTAGDDDIVAIVTIGKLPETVERFEIDTEHRLVDLGELQPVFSQARRVKMLSLDVNHEFKNLEWLPETVKDLNFCGLPSSCPPKIASGLTRLAICLEEMKVFQTLRCPNLEYLHIHSLQPEEAICSFVDSLKYCPRVKRLKCSGASARTVATIVESANWNLESLSLEYDPYQSCLQNKRLARACKNLKELWICTHKGDISEICYAYTSMCNQLATMYLTWEGWVWKIGDLLENDLIIGVEKSKLLGKYTFLDGHLYNQTFDLDIDNFNSWYIKNRTVVPTIDDKK